MRRIVLGLIALVALASAPMVAADAVGATVPSICRGATNGGTVAGAERLPIRGVNFDPYCLPCVLALRTYGHAPAVEATLAAYDALAASRLGTRFVYGEVGHPWGRRFPPHRTHRNGLSFDFMVPLVDGKLPTSVWNRFGYDEAFDADGMAFVEPGVASISFREIDFHALAAHLRALERAARERGGSIALVVLAPDLQDDLERADPGITGAMRFNRGASWVRHDDHYHVDFRFPCEG